MSVERIQQAYGGVAERYIELFGTAEQVPADDVAFIGRHLSARPGRVLDVGCGPGHLTAHLRSLGVDAAGIDVVPEFVAHATKTHPSVEFRLGSLADLHVADHSIAGILAYYSLIHLPPPELDGVLAGFRRAMAPAGTLVVGFFDGDEVDAFDHKVLTAYRWPADELSARLTRAGFSEIARLRRPGDDTQRPQAIIAATAVDSATDSETATALETAVAVELAVAAAP